jgi:N-acetylglucosamine kinase-like BadF-type ATPase
MSIFFLGVDGGQSSTRACIGDETGRVVGVGHGGPCNDVAAAIQSAVGAACAQAGLSPDVIRFSSACLGLSGGPADKEAIVREILRADKILVTDDAFVALAGATAGEPGVIIIAGTGSMAFGRNLAGGTARAGGWGYLFGDEGGAFWIVRQAMRVALREEEGWGVPSALRKMLLDATGAKSMNDLMHRCYTPEFPRARAAGLAILVNEAAEEGVPAAIHILHDAASELVRLANAVRGQLFQPSEPTLLAWWGGVFRSRIVLARFQEVLASQPGVRLQARVYEPVVGALLEAYRVAGVRISTIQL